MSLCAECGYDPAEEPACDEDGPGPFTIVLVLRGDRLRDEYVGTLITVESSLLSLGSIPDAAGRYFPVQEVLMHADAAHLLGTHYAQTLDLAMELISKADPAEQKRVNRLLQERNRHV